MAEEKPVLTWTSVSVYEDPQTGCPMMMAEEVQAALATERAQQQAQLAAKDEMLQSIGVVCGFPVVLNVEQLAETIKKHIARIHRESAAKDEEIKAAFMDGFVATYGDPVNAPASIKIPVRAWAFDPKVSIESDLAPEAFTAWLAQRHQEQEKP